MDGGRHCGLTFKRENRQYSVGGGRWWDRLHFSSGRSKSNDPPGHNRGKHDNQTYVDGVWAEMAEGWCGGFGFTGDVCQIFGWGGV